MKSLYHFIFIVITALQCNLLSAQTIEQEMPNHKMATANFFVGDNNQSPILILHGFLQTNEFPTVNALATSLNEAGYTTLSPTLTLGINKRKKSLACEAIHTHNLQMDAEEIRQWISWLHEKTGKKVTLIGHSAGTMTILNSMEASKDEISRAILISLHYFGEGPSTNETKELADKARLEIQNNRDPLHSYALSFCKTYPTTASNFLSYFTWNREKVSSIAGMFSKKTSVIIGAADDSLYKDWPQQLRDEEVKVITIEGANHFFDGTHEFDLFDSIESLLEDAQ